MVERDALHQRGQALENQYFQRVDQELLRRLLESEKRSDQLAELANVTGLQDDEIGSHLLDAGIDASNVAALTLTPLVFVAWSSGTVTPEERQGVISAALRRGVNSNPIAFQLLEQWLDTRPPRSLWKVWKEFASALNQDLPPTTANKLRNRLLGQAEEVALASGGFLGVDSICPAERRTLTEIADVLPERVPSPVENGVS